MTNQPHPDLLATVRLPALTMAELVYGPRPRRVRLPQRLIFVAALLGMSMGCASQAKPVTAEVESVGTLAPSYASIATAPVHHDAPPEFVGVVGSDDDDVTSVATTVSTGEVVEAPEVVAKSDGVTVGGVR